MEQGLRVKAAVIAGAAPSVTRWTDEDTRRCQQTAAALRGSTDVDEDLPGVVAFFESIGADTTALAYLFDDHHPTVHDWAKIVDPIFVVAGVDDTMAGPVDALVEKLPNATAHQVAGDHFTAPMAPAFCDLVVEATQL